MNPANTDPPAAGTDGLRPTVRHAETIAIGTELLLGEITDTNGAWLAGTLAARGVDVYWSLRVGDNLDRIVDALRTALTRSDLVVTSGGLGPTEDDLTREAIATAVGEEPAVDAELERALRERFARYGRAMPERNLKQAWRIPSAVALANPRGTAPGWLVRTTYGGEPRWIAALPGPPRELTRMARHELLPALRLPAAALWTMTLKTAGIGESDVADRLGSLALAANPSVATYARRDGVHVRVAAKAAESDAAEALGRPVADDVEARLGDTVWGRDDASLEDAVVASLRARGLRLAVVERATGGALTARLTAVPDAGENVMGAVLPWATIANDVPGAFSVAGPDATVAEVARSARRYFAADAAIASGELCPEQGGGARVDLAISGATGEHLHTVHLPEASGPHARDRVVLGALDLLRRRLPST